MQVHRYMGTSKNHIIQFHNTCPTG